MHFYNLWHFYLFKNSTLRLGEHHFLLVTNISEKEQEKKKLILTKCFTCVISICHLDNIMRQVLLIIPFHGFGKWGSERLREVRWFAQSYTVSKWPKKSPCSFYVTTWPLSFEPFCFPCSVWSLKTWTRSLGEAQWGSLGSTSHCALVAFTLRGEGQCQKLIAVWEDTKMIPALHSGIG